MGRHHKIRLQTGLKPIGSGDRNTLLYNLSIHGKNEVIKSVTKNVSKPMPFQPADPSSSSSYPTGLNRRSTTIRGVRCCIWWPANVVLAVIVCFLIFCLWQLPEEHDEYPDGFITCPNSTYRILDNRNVTIGCKSCLECPVGQQLVPPCGSPIQSETSIKCKKCPPDTYKESQGVGKCKPCQTCGIRGSISQCTPQKNALCGECPRGYYQEDHTLDSCKSCSTCCDIKGFAELECIYLKQCLRKNCTQQLKITTSSLLKCGGFQSRYYNGTFPFKLNERMLSINSGHHASQAVKDASTDTLKRNVIDLGNATIVRGSYRRATLSTLQSKVQDGLGTTFEDSAREPLLQLTSNKSRNGNKQLTILIVVAGFVGVIAIMLILIGVIIVWKMQSGNFPGSGCTITCCPTYILKDGNENQPLLPETYSTVAQLSFTDSDCQQIPHISNNGVDTCSEKSERWWPDDLASLPLCDLSPTLRNELIKRLDVCHKGEYGWKKLGDAFEVEGVDLKYLETAYLQRPVGSPTEELLKILETKCIIVGEVLNKLQGSYVNHPDVAQLICQKWQDDQDTK